MSATATGSHSAPERRYDVDWLRIIAVALLIPFHAARLFDIFDPFYAKNAVLSPALSYGVVAFLNVWHMPLLFLLAGASSWYALRRRSGGHYLAERVKRLLVPFLFGLVVIVPPQAYYGLRTATGYEGTFLAFLGRYWQITLEDLSGYRGTFTPAHLWFILFLFVLSSAALPIFMLLRGERGRRFVARASEWLARPGRIYLLALLPWLTGGLPDVGGLNPFTFWAYVILGYLLASSPALEQAALRLRAASTVLAMVGMALVLTGYALRWSPPDPSLSAAMLGLVRELTTWGWLLTLTAYGRSYLTRGGPVLRYAAEAAYPFYILHQTVIIVLGFYLVQWQAPIATKFVLMCILATLGTLGLYEALVRRWNALRFLFGMHPRPRRQPAEESVRQPA